MPFLKGLFPMAKILHVYCICQCHVDTFQNQKIFKEKSMSGQERRARLFNHKQFSDLTIVLRAQEDEKETKEKETKEKTSQVSSLDNEDEKDETEIQVGLQWLASKSDYFLSLLWAETEERKTKKLDIVLPKNQHAAFRDLLQCAYSAKLTVVDDAMHSFRVLVLADRYDFPDIAALAVQDALRSVSNSHHTLQDDEFEEALHFYLKHIDSTSTTWITARHALESWLIQFTNRDMILSGNPEEVQSLLSEAKKASRQAMYNLGLCYEKGKQGMKQDKCKAFAWYLFSAARGHAHAEYAIGICYEESYYVSHDLNQSLFWMKRAAGQGFASALYFFAIGYFWGINHIEKNPALAIEWLIKAAEKNHAKAQFRLGEAYYHGKGVEKDPVIAFGWWERAAHLGFVEAQTNLGLCYSVGQGVAVNKEKATVWLTRAAEQKNHVAQWNLGRILFTNGNEQKASFWFKDALPHPGAQFALGILSAKHDRKEEALDWFQKAASQGYSPLNLMPLEQLDEHMHLFQNKTENTALEWWTAARQVLALEKFQVTCMDFLSIQCRRKKN